MCVCICVCGHRAARELPAASGVCAVRARARTGAHTQPHVLCRKYQVECYEARLHVGWCTGASALFGFTVSNVGVCAYMTSQFSPISTKNVGVRDKEFSVIPSRESRVESTRSSFVTHSHDAKHTL